jgi:hypothetical protein
MRRLLLLLLFLQAAAMCIGQPRHIVSGFISDSKAGERLTGATIFNTFSNNGTVSNNYGFFSLSIPAGNCNLEFRFIGYKSIIKSWEIRADTFLNIRLEQGINLEEIKISGRHPKQGFPELSPLSQPRINMQMIESVPVIMGESDVLKALQYMPGVKQGAENSASMNVRGGSADQNLILLDGVPVYNVNHLLGFFSVFNTDAIKDVELIKGGIPARYGDRLSSVLNISMKEGNLKESSGVFSISPVAGRFTIEGPIKKDTASFIVSMRRTFLDIPLRTYLSLVRDDGNFGYYFYDINAKANWILNSSNRLYFSVYMGKDSQFSNGREGKDIKSQFRYNWGNITSVLRWNKVFSAKMFSNFSMYYSHYHHLQLGKAEDRSSSVLFKTKSDLKDLSIKADFDYYTTPYFTVRFGGKVSRMEFSPNIRQIRTTDSDIAFNQNYKNHAHQADIYLENSIQAGKLAVNAGGRLTGYFTGNKNYLHFQPRLAASYQLFQNFNVNAAYTQMIQSIHLLTNSSLGMPTDLWVASTQNIAPQEAKQVSFGFSHNARQGYLFGIEGYYKWMDKVIRFDEGVSFLTTKESNWENLVLTGEGRAYGIEFLSQKDVGKLTGMLSYTLSWSDRRFNGLNNEKCFPCKYDRRHDVSVMAEYTLKKSYKTTRSLSAGFTLQSGNNLSIPDVEYEGLLLPGFEFNEYNKDWGTRRYTYDNPNNFKMPTFHHLDIGYSIVKQKTGNRSVTWSFTIYNVYNRMNPWYYYKSGGTVKQVSFFPVIPSVGYKYNF